MGDRSKPSAFKRVAGWWQERCPIEVSAFGVAGLLTMLILALAGV